jgi:hypothetical protein
MQEVFRSMEPLTYEDTAIKDEMAYLVNCLSALLTKSEIKQEAERVQALKYLEGIRELLSKWSHRYIR